MSLPDEIKNCAVFFIDKNDKELYIGYVLNKSYHTVKLYNFYNDDIIDLDKNNGDVYLLYEDEECKSYLEWFFSQNDPNIILNMMQKGEEKKQEFNRYRHSKSTPQKPPRTTRGGRKTRKKKRRRTRKELNKIRMKDPNYCCVGPGCPNYKHCINVLGDKEYGIRPKSKKTLKIMERCEKRYSGLGNNYKKCLKRERKKSRLKKKRTKKRKSRGG